MIETRFEYLSLDESPPTIAYVLVSMMATMFGAEIEAETMGGDEWVNVLDSDGDLVFRVGVSPMMGRLLIAVLDRTAAELNGTHDEGW